MPLTFGHSFRFLHTLHKIFSLVFSPPSLAVCGHRLSMGEGGGGGCTQFVHGRSRMAIVDGGREEGILCRGAWAERYSGIVLRLEFAVWSQFCSSTFPTALCWSLDETKSRVFFFSLLFAFSAVSPRKPHRSIIPRLNVIFVFFVVYEVTWLFLICLSCVDSCPLFCSCLPRVSSFMPLDLPFLW